MFLDQEIDELRQQASNASAASNVGNTSVASNIGNTSIMSEHDDSRHNYQAIDQSLKFVAMTNIYFLTNSKILVML